MSWLGEIQILVDPQVRSIEVFRKQTTKIVRIQRWWRTNHYKKQFQQLVLSSSSDIKMSTLRQFLHLLDLRSEDFEQELELQSLKGQVRTFFVALSVSCIIPDWQVYMAVAEETPFRA